MSFDGRPAIRVAQDTSGSWGAFLLVTYSLGKQRKVTRRKGEKQHHNQPQTPGHQRPPHDDQSKNNLLLQSHPTPTPADALRTKVTATYKTSTSCDNNHMQSDTNLLQGLNDKQHFYLLTNEEHPGKQNSFFFNSPTVVLSRCSGSPSAAPRNAGLTGAVGHRLSESRSSSRALCELPG